VADSTSFVFTSIQCIYRIPLSLSISTLIVPGVKVIELAKNVKAVSVVNLVFTLTIPGFIGNRGCKTRYATSRLP